MALQDSQEPQAITRKSCEGLLQLDGLPLCLRFEEGARVTQQDWAHLASSRFMTDDR